MTLGVSLKHLIAPWLDIEDARLADIVITRLDLDSRNIGAGDTFVAVKGHATDGRQYIEKAVSAGAALVLAQAEEHHTHGVVRQYGDTPVLYLAGLPDILSELAGRLYSSEPSTLIGVTGTNGKTTITQLIAQWIALTGKSAAVMGTTGNGFLPDLQPAANTTGSAIEIQATLNTLNCQGAQYTALEVSSHGLVQGRVKALDFAVSVFSNLSRDHLDYHQTMAAYAEAKLSLFTQHRCASAVINADDETGVSWLQRIPDPIAVSIHGQPSVSRSVWANNVQYSEQGITLEFEGCFGRGVLCAPLIGEFNASNLLLAMTSLLALGFDKDTLLECAGELRPVIGRMELFQRAGKAKVVVDYAHTPDALEKALRALRVHCQGRLWAIFGCGGDRDRGKRPMMASTAELYADQIILTDDNPRSEAPAAIVQDMLAGLNQPESARIEHNRFAALEYALSHAGEQDIILLAGKGHEDYQVLTGETIHYSDRESAQQLLGAIL